MLYYHFAKGKERLYLEVARVLRKKIYVTAGKLHILKCLDFPEEDMQWFTLNEHESQIHVVPMWTLASFKRLKHVSNQYAVRFNPFSVICYDLDFVHIYPDNYLLDVAIKSVHWSNSWDN